MRLTLENVREAVGEGPLAPNNGGTRGGNSVFSGVSTDTRTLKPGELFVALVSPQADGHDFVAKALDEGAAGLVVSRDVSAPADVPIVRVSDTQTAYGQIARFWRDQFDIPVVGVTGSVGKTTVKEMLAAALSPLGPILKTTASQNNETGVPKLLLQLTEDHKAAVVEMGMRGAGQIAYLCGIACPTIGVITLIGDNHVEMLGSREAIADAKGELLESLPPDGVAVLNADDPFLPRLREKTAARVVTCSSTPKIAGGRGDADYQVTQIARLEAGWHFIVRDIPVEIATVSRHDVQNALAALAVANTLGVPLQKALEALGNYAAPPMRMQVVQTHWGGTILNDAYNAAPASMASALETLKTYPGGRKIAFLGDMKELGEQGPAAHEELGAVIARLGGVDALYTAGELAALIPNAARRFHNSAEAAQFAQAMPVQAGDVALVKGSRAMAMEKIVQALAGREGNPLAPSSGGTGGRTRKEGADTGAELEEGAASSAPTSSPLFFTLARPGERVARHERGEGLPELGARGPSTAP